MGYGIKMLTDNKLKPSGLREANYMSFQTRNDSNSIPSKGVKHFMHFSSSSEQFIRNFYCMKTPLKAF